MPVSQTPSYEQWLLLGVFFILFAVYGFTKSTQGAGCRPCYYIFIGILAVAANSLVLLIANRSGVDEFNLLQLITLKQTTIESSFIVFGYCLIVQGIAMVIRWLFLPASVRATRHLL